MCSQKREQLAQLLEERERLHEFVDGRVPFAAFERRDEPVLDIVTKRNANGGVDRAPYGGELLQDVDDVAILVQHLDYTIEVPTRRLQAIREILASLQIERVAVRIDFPAARERAFGSRTTFRFLHPIMFAHRAISSREPLGRSISLRHEYDL